MLRPYNSARQTAHAERRFSDIRHDRHLRRRDTFVSKKAAPETASFPYTYWTTRSIKRSLIGEQPRVGVAPTVYERA